MVNEFFEAEPNLIESSQGFSIRVLGRTGLRYSEKGRSVWIDSEVLTEPVSIVLAKSSIRSWEGEDPAAVSVTDRERIATNIKRAFEACGYQLEVAEPFDWHSVAVRPPNERRK